MDQRSALFAFPGSGAASMNWAFGLSDSASTASSPAPPVLSPTSFTAPSPSPSGQLSPAVQAALAALAPRATPGSPWSAAGQGATHGSPTVATQQAATLPVSFFLPSASPTTPHLGAPVSETNYWTSNAGLLAQQASAVHAALSPAAPTAQAGTNTSTAPAAQLHSAPASAASHLAFTPLSPSTVPVQQYLRIQSQQQQQQQLLMLQQQNNLLLQQLGISPAALAIAMNMGAPGNSGIPSIAVTAPTTNASTIANTVDPLAIFTNDQLLGLYAAAGTQVNSPTMSAAAPSMYKAPLPQGTSSLGRVASTPSTVVGLDPSMTGGAPSPESQASTLLYQASEGSPDMFGHNVSVSAKQSPERMESHASVRAKIIAAQVQQAISIAAAGAGKPAEQQQPRQQQPFMAAPASTGGKTRPNANQFIAPAALVSSSLSMPTGSTTNHLKRQREPSVEAFVKLEQADDDDQEDDGLASSDGEYEPYPTSTAKAAPRVRRRSSAQQPRRRMSSDDETAAASPAVNPVQDEDDEDDFVGSGSEFDSDGEHKRGKKGKPHSCRECGRCFASFGHMNRLVSTGNLELSSKMQTTHFLFPCLLSRHMKSHLPDDQKPHLCTYEGCGRRFARSDNLRMHQLTHDRSLGKAPKAKRRR